MVITKMTVKAAPTGRRAAGLAVVCSLLISGCTALVVGGAGSRSSYPAPAGESQQSADQRISAAVRAQLAADRSLSGATISVSTLDGVVTLQGEVADYSARSQAETLVAGISGVRGIHNRLQVAGRL